MILRPSRLSIALRSTPLFIAFAALAACRSAPAPTPPAASTTTPASSAAAAIDHDAAFADSLDASTTDSSTTIAQQDDSGGGRGNAPEGMLLVPGGTFKMGADEGGEGDEHPAHDVTVASFYLDKTEVTQAAYNECVEAKVCAAPDQEILDSFAGVFKAPQKPVIGISWFSAHDYCNWRGKRLPREAEYERAVRGDDGRKFPWGNDAPTKERSVFGTNYTEEVGSHPLGRGPYGHDDLSGNVWEWIEDDYDPFAYTRATADAGKPGSCDEINAAQNKLRAEGRQGFTGTNPIPTECEKNIRGGAYNYPAAGLRSTNRIHHPPKFKLRMTGARCAKDT